MTPLLIRARQSRIPTKASLVMCPWKEGTILVMGDSMLNGVDEGSLSNNGMVKVRSFSGSAISDLQNYYIKPLLRKKPTKIIMHISEQMM